MEYITTKPIFVKEEQVYYRAIYTPADDSGIARVFSDPRATIRLEHVKAKDLLQS